MSTKAYFPLAEISASNPIFTQTRAIIEAAFYGNNVVKINTLREAYELAKNSPGTVVTDMPVYKAEELGLEKDAKVLLFNDGNVSGRAAAARKISGEPGVNVADLEGKTKEAIYQTRNRLMYHAEVYIGLHEDFMVKAHLLIPEGEENIMYSWMLNFQYMSDEYVKMYKNSKPIEGEGDIYIFSDPQWSHPDHPMGLTFFDTNHNCASLLGMRYFGEHKKGTLTIAWAVANRHGYASCHGGQKKI